MTRRRGATSAIALCMMGLVGCGGAGGDGPGGAWAGTVRDSAGIAVVSNPERGTWAPEDRWTVGEELRIGAMDGDPAYQFGQISGIAELSDGRIAILDQQAQELRIFSAEGVHLRTVGGAGSGPGELGVGAGPVLVGPGDSIYVPDISNQRLARFTPEAEPAGTSPLDFGSGIPLAWQDTPAGLLISQMRPLGLEGGATEDVIVTRGPDGAVRDTLLRFASGGTFRFSDGLPDLTFFSPEPIWSTTSTGGLVYGVNDDFRLRVYEDGEVSRIIEKRFEPRPVTESDQAVMRDAMMRVWEEFGLPQEALAVMRDRMGFAEFFPAYALIRGGPQGSIWVQRLTVPSDLSEEERENFNPTLGFGSPEWDVFAPQGRYLGVLRMPDGFQPLRMEGDRIFGILRDELDVQHALILRLALDGEELESAGAS